MVHGCLPPPTANMRRVLTRIAQAEGKGRAVEEVESIVASSRGDLRHAILTLQLQLQGRCSSLPSSSPVLPNGKGLKKKGGGSLRKEEEEGRREMRMGRKKGEREQEQEQEEQQKDAYMSNFHAIGKVLHAKRRSPLLQDVEGKEGGQEARGSLAFVPEDVLGKCEMEVDGLATFIQAHCVHHFGDLGELSHALGLFSDADVLLARVFSTAFVSRGTEGRREGGRDGGRGRKKIGCVYCVKMFVMCTFPLHRFFLNANMLTFFLPPSLPSFLDSSETRQTRPFLTSMCSPFWAAQLPAPIGTQSAAREEEDEEEGLEE